MKLSVCTISFRHQLISLEQIVNWAKIAELESIELWGVHAKNLHVFSEYNSDWLAAKRISVSMISDYLALDGSESLAIAKLQDLCELAHFWRSQKIRTFAGNKPSSEVSLCERSRWVARLRHLCELAASYNKYLVVETHPNTLADTTESTLSLIEEVAHDCLKINFDVIHVWEAGDDPLASFTSLSPHIAHIHLKNIRDRSLLSVFNPENVYAPAGDREGMVGLFDGAFNYDTFFKYLKRQVFLDFDNLDASLEWFGPNVLSIVSDDSRRIRQVVAVPKAEDENIFAHS